MTTKKGKLTLFEAACLIAGLGVGGGIMTVPYLASLNGIVSVLAIMTAAYGISVVLHLMVVEVVLRDEEPKQLVEIFGKYLFSESWWGKALTWLIFTLIVITFYTMLAGYIVGCGEILRNITGIPLWAGEIGTYALAAGVVFFGLKAIGLSEKWAIIGIAIVLLVLSIGTLRQPLNHMPAFAGNVKTALALYGMLMFCFSCIFSVPQAAEGLSWNKRLVPWAVVLGIGINLLFVVIVGFMAMLVSKPVTEIAIIGWGGAIGKWALVLGTIFVFLALITTYWSVSYALSVVIVERLGWTYRLSWLVATLPTLILAVAGMGGFLALLRYAGGAMAILMAILIPAALMISRRRSSLKVPTFDMGFWGSPAVCIVVISAYVLAAIGSLLAIE